VPARIGKASEVTNEEAKILEEIDDPSGNILWGEGEVIADGQMCRI
jgi:hypothetical protein